MRRYSAFILLAFGTAAGTAGVVSASPHSPTAELRTSTDSTWSRFFSGSWRCQGGFPNGRRLTAHMSFTAEQGGQWLEYRHVDDEPKGYMASALWGEQRGVPGVIGVLHDAGGGVRVYRSPGWLEDALVFVRDTVNLKVTSDRPVAVDRFTYRRVTDATFWFAWERLVSGGAWTIGDSLTCRRG